jgi:LEA14-like dessication related protein
MKKITKLFTIVLLGSFMLTSCAVYKEVEVKEVLNVEVTEFDQEGAECNVYLTIYNPNGYNIHLTESHVDLFFEGKPLGEVQLLEPVLIPKKSQSTVMMKCEAGYESMQLLMGNALSLLFKSEYQLEGKGYIRGKAMLISKKVPVSFSQKLTKKDLGF